MNNKVRLPFTAWYRIFLELLHTKVIQSRPIQVVHERCINQSASQMADHGTLVEIDDINVGTTHACLIQHLQETNLCHTQTLDTESLAGKFLEPADRTIGPADQGYRERQLAQWHQYPHGRPRETVADEIVKTAYDCVEFT